MRILALILFAACGSRDAETASNVDPASGETQPNEEEATANAPQEIPMDPSPVPAVDLLSVEDEGISLRVRAVGADAVELRRGVRIEAQNGDAWAAVDAEYQLRADCEDITGECLSLAAGAELSPPSIHMSAGQCGGSELAPGTYRFVVQSCAPEDTRPHEIHSVFTLNP